ncbi:hypothetical protein SERLA73DRAFT_178973 [Serpula lacrymans var. lacrymans S7.3]|uniref:Uncharacterized protein n=2 Tax=Serpula lacrymans var. lacrymans TaxID=341189 RepID=F8PTE0_SERL3|nr:uncharacterized protein SERLADRAFT_463805 [Serpula lacrymans var. lacrymans S7.9]EGO00970.1 hypothetical protein SERLA73DRAFT_178973 [Serpula lacrymans var. lacrymans S7.3]EGO26603.1 hypothetical protein SERLADRAFT_463805 [Serpula lacrymans var. lacrymans S7.9]
MPSYNSVLRINLVCAWFGAMLYGVNAVLFGRCVYILSKKHRSTNRILLYSSSLSFAFATSQAIVTLVELAKGIEAVVHSEAQSEYDLGMLGGNKLNTVGITMYCLDVFVQDLLLIWRLFIVWNYSKKICVFPALLFFGELVSAMIAIAHFSQPMIDLKSHNVELYAIAAWAVNTAYHVCITAGISYRLWLSGQRLKVIGGRQVSSYRSTVAMMVESGCLSVLCGISLLVCFAVGDITGLAGVDIAGQLATTVPLLIIVRVGFGNDNGTLGDSNPSTGIRSSGHTSRLSTLPWALTQIGRANVQGVAKEPSSPDISKIELGLA